MIGALLGIALFALPAFVVRYTTLEKPLSKKMAFSILAPIWLIGIFLFSGSESAPTLVSVGAVVAFTLLVKSDGENEADELEIISWEEFMERTMGGRPNQMDMSPYEGNKFQCACGKTHPYHSHTVDVMRELPNSKLVFACPAGDAITCVQLRWRASQDFKPLFGARNAQREPK